MAALLVLALGTGAQPVLVDGVAAVIGRKVITLSEVRAEGRMVLVQRAGRLGLGRSLDVAFLRSVLDYVLVQELLVQRARRDSIVVVEAEVDRGTAVFKARFDSEAQYKGFLRSTGIDEEFLRTVVRRDLAVAELLRRRHEAHPVVIDDDVVASFLSGRPDFYPDQPDRARERAARDAIVQQTRQEELAHFLDELKAEVEVRLVAAWAKDRRPAPLAGESGGASAMEKDNEGSTSDDAAAAPPSSSDAATPGAPSSGAPAPRVPPAMSP